MTLNPGYLKMFRIYAAAQHYHIPDDPSPSSAGATSDAPANATTPPVPAAATPTAEEKKQQ